MFTYFEVMSTNPVGSTLCHIGPSFSASHENKNSSSTPAYCRTCVAATCNENFLLGSRPLPMFVPHLLHLLGFVAIGGTNICPTTCCIQQIRHEFNTGSTLFLRSVVDLFSKSCVTCCTMVAYCRLQQSTTVRSK